MISIKGKGKPGEGSSSRLSEEVGKKEARKIKARRSKDRGVWFGLGTFGLVGWSVAIPTLIFTALGIWIDAKSSGRYSWTLMLLLVGVIVGCLNAWFWVNRERRVIQENEKRGIE